MLLAFLSWPATAFCQVNTKTAVAMMQQAAKAYEAGDFAKAADFYGKAWRLDPLPTYLWSLARAEHLAGLFGPASEHYRDFMDLPDADAARKTKAKGYLVEAEAELAKSQIREAEVASHAGKPAVAAELYLSAWKVLPNRGDLLFKAAAAEQLAEQLPSALRHFEQYLAQAPTNAPDRADAQVRQAWLKQKLGPTPQVAKPLTVVETPKVGAAVQTPVEKSPPNQSLSAPPVVARQAEQVQTWPSWTLVGTGGALLVGGLVVLIGGMSDAAALNKAQQTSGSDWIYGLTYADAQARASSANTRIGVGAALAGTGVVAAGVGTWLLLRGDGPKSAFLPTTNGAQWVVQF